jgi:hypothetical protein
VNGNSTVELRARVLQLATGLGTGRGITEESIAADIGITVPTLKKYYQGELDRGRTELYAKACDAVELLISECHPQIVGMVWKTLGGHSEKIQQEVTGKDGKELTGYVGTPPTLTREEWFKLYGKG